MLFDKKGLFEIDAALAGTGTTIVFADVVDTGDAGLALGVGEPVSVGAIVTTVPSTLTVGITSQLAVTHCATVGGTYTSLVNGPAVEAADLVLGKIQKVVIPTGALRYLKLSSINVASSFFICIYYYNWIFFCNITSWTDYCN